MLKIQNQNILIILHYDWDEYIKLNLPINDIIQYANTHNYKIIEMYHNKPAINITNILHIKDTSICTWDNGNFDYDNTTFKSNLLYNNNIILTGGYLNQCIEWTYTHLITSNKVYINYDWTVKEPFYLNKYWSIPKESLIHIDNKISA